MRKCPSQRVPKHLKLRFNVCETSGKIRLQGYFYLICIYPLYKMSGLTRYNCNFITNNTTRAQNAASSMSVLSQQSQKHHNRQRITDDLKICELDHCFKERKVYKCACSTTRRGCLVVAGSLVSRTSVPRKGRSDEAARHAWFMRIYHQRKIEFYSLVAVHNCQLRRWQCDHGGTRVLSRFMKLAF